MSEVGKWGIGHWGIAHWGRGEAGVYVSSPAEAPTYAVTKRDADLNCKQLYGSDYEYDADLQKCVRVGEDFQVKTLIRIVQRDSIKDEPPIQLSLHPQLATRNVVHRVRRSPRRRQYRFTKEYWHKRFLKVMKS